MRSRPREPPPGAPRSRGRWRWRWRWRARDAGAPLAAEVTRAGAAATMVLGVLATLAGAVRVLPWVIDARVGPRVAMPFARSVVLVSLEAAILVGFPVGWALAAQAFVERGEARVLATLGESPRTTTLRLAPRACLFALLLAIVSAAGARDATEPGRVVTALLDEGEAACSDARASGATTRLVPFLGATWLCDPAMAPRLAGAPPGALGSSGGAFFTAAGARVAPDLRRVDLDDAWIALAPDRARAPVTVHAREAVLRGLPPFAFASNVPPWGRALALALTGVVAALTAVLVALRRDLSSTSRLPPRLVAIAVGAAGPLAAIGLLHAVERSAATPPVALAALVLMPIVSALAAASLAYVAGLAELVPPARGARRARGAR